MELFKCDLVGVIVIIEFYADALLVGTDGGTDCESRATNRKFKPMVLVRPSDAK